MALKIQNQSHKQAKEQEIKTEYNIIKQLNHPNIIKVFDYYDDLYLDSKFCEKENRGFTMELAKCDLLNFLKQTQKMPINPKQIKNIFLNIAKALDYLHNRGISHNDIKLENILIFDRRISINEIINHGWFKDNNFYEQKEEESC
ncbi:protein kinase domain protein [Ichthyophthirius multifiliis]|uniref:Protein kinase domain protein n=1 Tax=Ichthyophthirius multifiliis TaxID=5932 RepID=G0QRH5_ICHMU|nr:protein kinase domain protein [Ichthyophthirius multifiliis]EGR32181.1 protein kinase domain protein [Ichthyophthirius multifiliis]|eukprot:XP_004035667.1 protein kinase domain protein [Ichthyophthirius multifiliis]